MVLYVSISSGDVGLKTFGVCVSRLRRSSRSTITASCGTSTWAISSPAPPTWVPVCVVASTSNCPNSASTPNSTRSWPDCVCRSAAQVPVYLSVDQSVCQSYISICLLIERCTRVYQSNICVCLSIIYQSVCLSINHLSVYHPTVYQLYVRLSVSLYTHGRITT